MPVKYDAKGNPSEVIYFEKEYNYNDDTFEEKEYRAEITYDNKPNFIFHTLKRGGFIALLDNSNIGFKGANIEAIKAKSLMPINNLTKYVLKNDKGEIVKSKEVTYQYDKDGYIIKATHIDSESTKKDTYVVNISYY